MPLPAVPTVLLAVGGMMLILGRGVPTSRWYEAVWLFAVLAASTLLFMEEVPAEVTTARTSIWLADSFAIAGQWLALLFGSIFGIGSFGIGSSRDRSAERFGYLSFLIAGVMLTSAANDLITMALATELVQFAAWSLRKLDRLENSSRVRDIASTETVAFQDDACVWVGIAMSCCLWLGISLVANLTGSLQFDEIRHVLTDAYVPDVGRTVIGAGSKLGLMAIGLIIAGLGSRIGLVPWHLGFVESTRDVSYWTTGCVLLAGQLTGVLALARLCGTVWCGYRDELLVLLLVAAGLTAAVSGTFAGLGLMPSEGRLRRFTISFLMLHAALLTIGLIAGTADLATPEHSLAAAGGQPSALGLLFFAVAASQIALAGVFLLLSYLSRDDREVEFIDELLGLGPLRPVAAITLLVLLGSLIGQPPLWGFWANWLLLLAGLNVRAAGARENVIPHTGLILLSIMATIAALMSASVVVRFARTMLLEQPLARTPLRGRRSALFVSCGCALALVAVGFFPARLLNLCSRVHSPTIKSGRENPAGSNRGQSTAQVRPE